MPLSSFSFRLRPCLARSSLRMTSLPPIPSLLIIKGGPFEAALVGFILLMSSPTYSVTKFFRSSAVKFMT